MTDTVWFERTADGKGVRAVLFSVDPETGCRSVSDIAEIDDFGARAARFFLSLWGKDLEFDPRQCWDFGRSQTTLGKVRRVVASLKG